MPLPDPAPQALARGTRPAAGDARRRARGASAGAVALLLAAALAWPLAAAAEAPAQPERSEHHHGGDVYLAGGAPTLTQPVQGDLFIAGGSIDVEAPVAGDVFAAGGRLRVDGSVGQSLHALGGQVEVRGRVGANLRMAGGQLELAPGAEVAGNVSALGGRLALRGPVRGHVQVGSGRVWIDGPVGGDVTVNAGELALGPNARIAGALRYRAGEELQRDPAAEVGGAIERLPALPRRDPGPGREDGDWRAGDDATRHRGMAVGFGAAWTAGLMLLAGLLVAVLPGVTGGISRTLRARPGASIGLGFALVVCVPVAVLLLLLTIVGIPVALLALATYLAALPLAYVLAALGLGDWALQRWRPQQLARRGWRWGAACAVLLALALAGWLPFVGALAGFVVLLLGLGAIALHALRPATAA
ncbi:MAG: hypothetical protein HYZ20_15910 [Burkholderiales bacterium]|nr:hypothetical protein [Burkholderiales bacterium]